MCVYYIDVGRITPTQSTC